MNAPAARRENALAGETMTFLSAPEEPVQRFALELAPVFHGPPAHTHPASSERFTVTGGSLAVRLGSSWRTLGAGDSVVVPPGAVHTYSNRSGSPVRVDVELDPGRAMRGFFEAMYALAESGALTRTGGLRPMQAARLFRRFPGAMTIAGPPAVVQPALWWALSRFGGS